jgi:hypothetical protein
VKRQLRWSALVVVCSASTLLSASAFAQNLSGSQTAASVEADKQKETRFGGFTFDFTLADSTGLNAVGENYRNELDFYFEPTWHIGQKWMKNTRFKTFSLGARFSLVQPLSGTDESYYSGNTNISGPEGTCGNPQVSGQGGQLDPGSVSYCHPKSNDFRTDYSDIWLTVNNPNIYTIPKLGIQINPSIRFILPTSAESRYQTLEFALTPSLSLSRAFYKDHIRLAAGFSYTKNFHKYTSPQFNPQTAATASTEGSNPYDGAVGAGLSNFFIDPTRTGTIGGYNASHVLAYTIDGSVTFNDKWSLDALYIIRSAIAYDHQCNDGVDGTTINTCQNGDAVAASSGSSLNRPGYKQDVQILWVSLGYQPVDWVGLSLMWINAAPLRSLDGHSYRQGIISTDYNGFTTLSLSATFSLDKIAARIWKTPKPLTAKSTESGLIQAKR